MDRDALVAALKAVQGVSDADVDPDAEGGLGTLRLDLEPGVDETAVAEAVSHVLRDRFGLGVDADRVALVEDQKAPEAPPPPVEVPEPPAAEVPPAPPAKPPVAEEAAPPPPPPPAPPSAFEQPVSETLSVTLPEGAPTQPQPSRSSARPSIARMHLVAEGLDVAASVTLSSGSRTATGEARGLASQTGVHRAVASATLQAVEKLSGGAVRVELDRLEVTPMGTERMVIVLLTMLTAQGSEHLTGAATVRDDVRQAVVRATLDALNRRLELLLATV